MSNKKQLLAQFELHNILFNNVLAGISDAEADRTIANPMNNVKWLAGHILWAQKNLAWSVAGIKLEIDWLDHFLPHFVPKKEVIGERPGIEEIKKEWNKAALIIKPGLENLSEDMLNSTVATKLPITPFDDTLAGVWAFLNHHQAYTIGQLGILRRGLGKNAMEYF